MAISEFDRHQVFEWFKESMGPERAATMMEILPPVPASEIVTKEILRAEMSELRAEINRDFAQHSRTVAFTIAGSHATLVALVLTVMRFFGG